MSDGLRRATSVRLYCIPYSGASALVYARWRRLLPTWIEVRPLELPGRGARMDEPLARNPHQLAEDLAREIVADIRAADGPYALFGHSLGALLAFELAHALLTLRAPPPLVVFASGTEAPSARDDSGWRRPRSDAELIEELRSKQGTPEEAIGSRDLMDAVLPVLRADFLMCGHYAYRKRARLPCPIRVFGGRQDETSREGLLAWQVEAGTDFGLSMFDGGHFFIHERSADVHAIVADDLARALAADAADSLPGTHHAA